MTNCGFSANAKENIKYGNTKNITISDFTLEKFMISAIQKSPTANCKFKYFFILGEMNTTPTKKYGAIARAATKSVPYITNLASGIAFPIQSS